MTQGPFICAVAAFSLGCAAPGVAQNTDAPLSVIDWLGTQNTAPVVPAAQAPQDEPPVTTSGTAPIVTVTPLGEGAPRAIGLVPTAITGLPADIWAGSEPGDLVKLIEGLPDLHLPAAQSLLYTVLLAEAGAPLGGEAAGNQLALARVAKLVERGALDPALSLIEQAGVTTSPDHFDLWMRISLLTGSEDRACKVLNRNPHLTRSYGARIFCDARASQWDNAALTFGSAQALGLMARDQLDLLDRFLHPEGFEDATPLPTPVAMDPLSFRLFETIGEPKSTRNLPREYAVADLRDVAGWKAQLEAAERLTRAGALPDNRLLGLYTDRKPAASGGIWDRARALQRFETALDTGSAEAVRKTLPPVWNALREAGLEVSFATLFNDAIQAVTLEGPAARIAFEVGLLSGQYEAVAANKDKHPKPPGALDALLVAVAFGEAPGKRPPGPVPGAVFEVFSGAAPRSDLVAAARDRRLGETILRVLSLLHNGARGDTGDLRDGLATLRALGLEHTARRAALQVLLLEG